MPKRCVLVDPTVSAVDLRRPIDWNKCLLCQQHTHESLVDPLKSLHKAGYEYLASILPQFGKLGELPSHLMVYCAEGIGFIDTLKVNNAKWHKSCRGAFSARELSRKTVYAEKRRASEAASVAGPSVDQDNVVFSKTLYSFRI